MSSDQEGGGGGGRVEFTKVSSRTTTNHKPNIFTSSTSNTPPTREVMLHHRLLTIEEEKKLGQALHRGAQLQSKITQLMEQKAAAAAAAASPMMVPTSTSDFYDDDITRNSFSSHKVPPYLLETRSTTISSSAKKRRDFLLGTTTTNRSSSSNSINLPAAASAVMDHRYNNYEQQPQQQQQQTNYLELTENEIINQLLLPGGRAEMMDVLLEAREARQTLIACNIKLVASIAKTWINRSRRNNSSMGQIYGIVGGWDVPSYDELLQEGILGLVRAVDKFDATRKLRFSTYATHWIQSYIRNCLQVASTTCLRIPSALHLIKVSLFSF